jgi:rhodanese-related sulfurtransferase
MCQAISLASGLAGPVALAVDDTYVHFLDGVPTSGRLVRMRLDGSGTTPLVTNFPPSPSGSMAASGGYVYFTTDGPQTGTWPAGVRRVASGAAQIVDVATSAKYSAIHIPGAIAVNSTEVYWGDTFNGRIYRTASDGSGLALAVNVTAYASGPVAIALDDTNVYAALNTSWNWLDLAGTSGIQAGGVLSGTLDTRANIAVDDVYVYVRTLDSVSGKEVIARALKATVSPSSKIVAPFDVGGAFAIDSANIYFWSSGAASMPKGIYRIAKDGTGKPVNLSTDVSNVADVAVHAEGGGKALYWVNQGTLATATGSILKVAL